MLFYPRHIDEDRQVQNFIKILRYVVVILVFVVTVLGVVEGSAEKEIGVGLSRYWWIPVLFTLLFFGAIVGLDIITPTRKLSTFSAILFGSTFGLLATLVLGFVIDLFANVSGLESQYDQLFLTGKVVLGLGLCYLGISTVLTTQDDFRLVIPYVEFAKQIRGPRPLILDTSVLIDGRMVDIADVGIIQTPIVIPRFVIDELQTLSDSSDKLKRERGRRGLEFVTSLQKSPRLDVTVDETVVQGKQVDQMLVELGRSMPGIIATTDLGLNKVASIHGVQVLNINDLANALKPNVIPGEPLAVKLLKPGEHDNQAVGYLADGTMVVAEDGHGRIGHEVTLIITSTMQTSAGRLIFGRLSERDAAAAGLTNRPDSMPAESDQDQTPPPAQTSPPPSTPQAADDRGRRPAGPVAAARSESSRSVGRNPRRL